MESSKKKKVTKKKVIKPRQQIKLTGKVLQKFIKENGYDPEKDRLPDGYKYGVYDGSDPKFG